MNLEWKSERNTAAIVLPYEHPAVTEDSADIGKDSVPTISTISRASLTSRTLPTTPGGDPLRYSLEAAALCCANGVREVFQYMMRMNNFGTVSHLRKVVVQLHDVADNEYYIGKTLLRGQSSDSEGPRRFETNDLASVGRENPGEVESDGSGTAADVQDAKWLEPPRSEAGDELPSSLRFGFDG
ncbi:hypothetical protein P7C73_g4490, partial [Tremellales sp. Uapishka_1]